MGSGGSMGYWSRGFHDIKALHCQAATGGSWSQTLNLKLHNILYPLYIYLQTASQNVAV